MFFSSSFYSNYWNRDRRPCIVIESPLLPHPPRLHVFDRLVTIYSAAVAAGPLGISHSALTPDRSAGLCSLLPFLYDFVDLMVGVEDHSGFHLYDDHFDVMALSLEEVMRLYGFLLQLVVLLRLL